MAQPEEMVHGRAYASCCGLQVPDPLHSSFFSLEELGFGLLKSHKDLHLLQETLSRLSHDSDCKEGSSSISIAVDLPDPADEVQPPVVELLPPLLCESLSFFLLEFASSGFSCGL